MATQTMTCKASVWPHRHRNEGYGPLDLRISYRNQPPIMQDRLEGLKDVWFIIDQPDERTNLTIIKLRSCPLPQSPREWDVDGERWYRARLRRIRQDKGVSIYLRARITNAKPHPIPTGKYDGTCKHTDQCCMCTFQAVSLQVKPEESRIIVP